MCLRQMLTPNKAFIRLVQVTIVTSLLVSAVLSRSLPGQLRVKKHTADQRIAELQALIALVKQLPKVKQEFGHGYIDPYTNGRRRKRFVLSGGDVMSSFGRGRTLPNRAEERDRVMTMSSPGDGLSNYYNSHRRTTVV